MSVINGISLNPVNWGFSVPPGRIRLNAFGKCIYLGRHDQEVQKALNHLGTR